jgi:membrane-associated phospholipid phosphatase
MSGGVASRADNAPRPGRLTGRGKLAGPTVRFAIAAAVSIALLALTFWGFVLTETGQRLENLALEGATFRDPVEIEGSLAGLSGISVLSFAAAIALVSLIGLARRRPGLALLAATVMVVSILLAEVLKAILERPHLVDGAPWLLVNTFPSGHATIAATIAIGALLVSPERLRWLVLPIVAVYAGVIAQAVQVAGWHRLSGTLGGMLVATVVACLALAFVAARGRVQPTAAGHVPRAVRVGLLAVTGATVVAAGIVLALPIIFPVLDAPRGSDSAFAHTALELAGVGMTVLVVVVFSALVEPFSLGAKAPTVSAPVPESVSAAPAQQEAPTDGPEG